MLPRCSSWSGIRLRSNGLIGLSASTVVDTFNPGDDHDSDSSRVPTVCGLTRCSEVRKTRTPSLHCRRLHRLYPWTRPTRDGAEHAQICGIEIAITGRHAPRNRSRCHVERLHCSVPSRIAVSSCGHRWSIQRFCERKRLRRTQIQWAVCSSMISDICQLQLGPTRH